MLRYLPLLTLLLACKNTPPSCTHDNTCDGNPLTYHHCVKRCYPQQVIGHNPSATWLKGKPLSDSPACMCAK